MPTLIQCTQCQRRLRVPENLLGKMVRCPNCQTKFAAQQAVDASSQTAEGSIVAPASGASQPNITPNVASTATAIPAETAEVKAAAASTTASRAPRFRWPTWQLTPPRALAVIGGVLLVSAILGLVVGSILAVAVEQAQQELRPPE